MFAFQEYSLILNLGTPKTSKCGKSFLVNKLISNEEKLRFDPVFSSVLTLTKKINFSKETSVMLADYNGCFSPDINPEII